MALFTASKHSVIAFVPRCLSLKIYSSAGAASIFTQASPAASCPLLCCFFHKQIEFAQPVMQVVVFFLVVVLRLQKPDQCYAALMLDRIAHKVSVKFAAKYTSLYFPIYSMASLSILSTNSNITAG